LRESVERISTYGPNKAEEIMISIFGKEHTLNESTLMLRCLTSERNWLKKQGF